MPKYNLIYVDEEPSKRNDFLRDTEDDFKVVAMAPVIDIDELIETLLHSQADAFVIDYKLGETDRTISYNGVEVVKKIHTKRPKFPCFIFTNYDNDAISESEDVNYVYSKDVMTGSIGKISFNDRIKAQIKNYQDNLTNLEQELIELIAKGKNHPLNSAEEQNLIKLDTLLNHYLNKNIDVPAELKESKQLKKLEELISISEKLLSKLNSSGKK